MSNTALCVQLQQALTEVAGANAPALKRDRVGFVEALQSPANLNGVRRVAVPGNGKRRQVELIYLQRGVEAGVQAAQPTAFCDASDQPEPRSMLVEVEHWVHRKLRFTEEELRRYCWADDPVFVANAILAELNALTVAVNKVLLTLQAANLGAFFDGSSVKNISWLDAQNQPQYFEESKLLEEYSLIGGSGQPLVIGAGDLAHYTRMTRKGCCTASGLDLGQAGEYSFFYDRFVNTAFASGEHYLVLAPGAVQLVTWNANVGDYARQEGRNESGTLVDPFTGLRFDLDQVWDACTKRYHLTIALNYGLVVLPPDAFALGDELAGVNYSLHFQKS